MPELDDDMEMEELVITDDVYSSRHTLGELYKNEETKKVMEKYLKGFSEDNPMFGMAEGMTLDMLASMSEEIFTSKLMYAINKELIQIKKG